MIDSWIVMAIYEVRLGSSHPEHQDMLVQMADTLEHLDRVSDDLFRRVSVRIDQSRARVQDIDRRVQAARAKIDKFTGSRKATRIFSSSRFPAKLRWA